MDPLVALAVGDQPLARLARRLEGARDAGRDVNRDDLTTFGEQQLVDGDEVPNRGLGGGRAYIGGAETLVECGVVGDVRLPFCSPSTAT